MLACDAGGLAGVGAKRTVRDTVPAEETKSTAKEMSTAANGKAKLQGQQVKLGRRGNASRETCSQQDPSCAMKGHVRAGG